MLTAPKPVIRTGPGPKDFEFISPETIQNMPISQYYRDIQGNIVNANSAFYYDTAFAPCTVAIAANAKQGLFAAGKGDTFVHFGGSGTTGGEKTELHTNMTEDGMFPGGTTFIMEGAGVQFVVPADKATTVGSNGAITAPDYTASVVRSGANNALAARSNLELRYIRGEEIKKRGPLKCWPAPPGIGLEGANGSPNGGFFQNGTRGLVQFTHPVVLGFGDKFSFELANVAGAAWTPTIDLIIEVYIWGMAIRTFQPY